MAEPSRSLPRGKRSRVLLVLTSLYGLLYVIFIASGNYGASGSEPLVVKLLFVLFIAGYVVAWKNERLGGALFLLWWIGMWYLGLFVARHDRGAGVVMGIPLVILAILLMRLPHGRKP
ncbi:MAG: hypothetical protein MUC72_07805 [Acidobacteria bacterium]|nr:hypothetical protein [Acidobacteriota bacterium]